MERTFADCPLRVPADPRMRKFAEKTFMEGSNAAKILIHKSFQLYGIAHGSILMVRLPSRILTTMRNRGKRTISHPLRHLPLVELLLVLYTHLWIHSSLNTPPSWAWEIPGGRTHGTCGPSWRDSDCSRENPARAKVRTHHITSYDRWGHKVPEVNEHKP